MNKLSSNEITLDQYKKILSKTKSTCQSIKDASTCPRCIAIEKMHKKGGVK